jgi:hypothetical protein
MKTKDRTAIEDIMQRRQEYKTLIERAQGNIHEGTTTVALDANAQAKVDELKQKLVIKMKLVDDADIYIYISIYTS